MWGAYVAFSLLIGILGVNGEFDYDQKLGSNKREFDCDRNLDSYCGHLLPPRRNDINISEEFDNLCPQILAFFECEVDYKEACEAGNEAYIEFLDDVVSYTFDACDKDSETHANMVRLLPCLQQQSQNLDRECEKRAMEPFYLEEDANPNILFDAAFQRRTKCYFIISKAACYVAQVDDQCADGAKEFVFDALQRIDFLSPICDWEDKVNILRSLETLELDELMKSNFKEVFRYA